MFSSSAVFVGVGKGRGSGLSAAGRLAPVTAAPWSRLHQRSHEDSGPARTVMWNQRPRAPGTVRGFQRRVSLCFMPTTQRQIIQRARPAGSVFRLCPTGSNRPTVCFSGPRQSGVARWAGMPTLLVCPSVPTSQQDATALGSSSSTRS